MSSLNSLHKFSFKVVIWSLVALLLIPGFTFWFAGHVQDHRDTIYLTSIGEEIAGDAKLTPEEKQAEQSFYAAHLPSAACDVHAPSGSLNIDAYLARQCETFSTTWQFHWIQKATAWMLMFGGFVVASMLALGGFAFTGRRAQYLSLTIGWNWLTAVCVVETILQGALLVWLSFWVTAYFTESYFIKLIVVAAILALGAIVAVIVDIFKRPPPRAAIDGVLLEEKDAPALWARIRTYADALNTSPPQQIVVGIDTNFFVTEAPLRLIAHGPDQRTEMELTGRTLFLSIPLLRVLSQAEADAVLVHELAHLRGGDTASSAALGPKLVRFDDYCANMRASVIAVGVFYTMRLYRLILEFALQRDSRLREFLADATAAQHTSAADIGRSLIKVAAYAQYRQQVEQQFFDQNMLHSGQLNFAKHVDAGLTAYAQSDDFLHVMATANVPHPFDSHPPLLERMRNVKHEIPADEFDEIVKAAPINTWATEIVNAPAIEERLWAHYEEQFKQAHEQALSWRLEPANPEEQAIVEKYFPAIRFQLKGDKPLFLFYSGIQYLEDAELLSWQWVKSFRYNEKSFGGILGGSLEITINKEGKVSTIKIPGVGDQHQAVTSYLQHYWRRDQVMRQFQQSLKDMATEPTF